ncbi:MAG: hypothetical protein JNL28_15645 [Planctomycetes bacterium]|nr:hypothetical protein [Planctomycetota bacterium]
MWDDTPPTGATLISATALAALAASAWWYFAARFLEGDRRALVCRAGAVVVFVVTALGLFVPIRATSRSGSEFCLVCGHEAYVVRILGLRFADSQPEPRTVHATQGARAALRGVLLSNYGAAFDDLIAPHDHRWHAFAESGFWYRDLPLLKDRELARAYVTRLGAVTDVKRIEALSDYEAIRVRQHASAGLSLDESFEVWRAHWRVLHPDWP